MADDCIHGLAAGLCDQCFPKPKPDVHAAAAALGRTSRPRAASRATPRAASRPMASSVPTARPVVDIGEQRIYHVTHVRNLAGILNSERVLADASADWQAPPAVDISSIENREVRRSTAVSGELTVADYVPFFLSPNAAVWRSIRTAAADPRLSPDARHTVASEFVFLVSTVKVVVNAQGADDGAIAVTDGDAAHVLTRFAATPEASERMLRKLRADEDGETILTAEFLVRGALPLELVTLIGVANDRAREAVKESLGSSAYEPKVAVYPPWFQPAQ